MATNNHATARLLHLEPYVTRSALMRETLELRRQTYAEV